MTEYITKEQVIDEVWDAFTSRDDPDLGRVIEENIERLPAADVVLVRHGRWTRIDYHDARCSECGHKTYYPDRIFLYCPECGARMDGGESDG